MYHYRIVIIYLFDVKIHYHRKYQSTQKDTLLKTKKQPSNLFDNMMNNYYSHTSHKLTQTPPHPCHFSPCMNLEDIAR